MVMRTGMSAEARRAQEERGGRIGYSIAPSVVRQDKPGQSSELRGIHHVITY